MSNLNKHVLDIPIQSEQTLRVVVQQSGARVREVKLAVMKGDHNRGIAKLSRREAERLIAFLADTAGLDRGAW